VNDTELKIKLMEPAMRARQYSKDNTNGNRSSHRTDLLNGTLVNNFLKDIFPEEKGFQIRCEERVDDSRGSNFKIDIVIYKGVEYVTLLHLKSVERSLNKNRNNYAHTVYGENQRVFGRIEENETGVCPLRRKCLSLHLEWMPNFVECGDRMEKTNPVKIDSAHLEYCAKGLYPEAKAAHKKISFDIVDDSLFGYDNVSLDVCREIYNELTRQRDRFES